LLGGSDGPAAHLEHTPRTCVASLEARSASDEAAPFEAHDRVALRERERTEIALAVSQAATVHAAARRARARHAALALAAVAQIELDERASLEAHPHAVLFEEE